MHGMRRLALAFLILALTALAVLAAWRWWTAPPTAAGAAMATAATIAPDDAEGILVLAQPHRTARWLVQHPQALGLLPIAAPSAYRGLMTLQPALRAVAEEAHGPLVVWWRGDAVAVAALSPERALAVLQRLAELRGLSFASDSSVARLATTPALLDRGRRASPPQPTASRLAVLARVNGHWWEGEATRATLLLRRGVAPEPPPAEPASRVEAADASTLGAALSLSTERVHGPVCLTFSAERGWGVALAGAGWPSALRTALGGRWPQPVPGAVPGAERWQGLFGTLFVLPRGGVTVASDLPQLAAVAACDANHEEGCLHGADLAWAATRIAAFADEIRLLGPQVGRWRESAPLLAALTQVRWRLADAGAVILLEW
ncbi:MAG: hypothetical protein ACHQQS_15040 [Thermoanaerobaculales bacterium]